MRRRGLLIVLSSPSGAGKSTLAQRISGQDALIGLSVSVTTRPRRSNEQDGKHYHFLSPEAFQRLRDSNALLEWDHIYGYDYGTPLAPVEAALATGRDVLFDIHWYGASQLRASFGPDLVDIFILPPSFSDLRARLERRAQDGRKTIARRMAKALEEIGHYGDYRYVIVNANLDKAQADIEAIVRAERLRRERSLDLQAFVKGFAQAHRSEPDP